MIRVTDNVMVSDAVDAPAYRLDHWQVPWLPKRILDRKEAIIAMHLAEIYSGDPAEDSAWSAVAHDYERELGLPRGFRSAWLRTQGPDVSVEVAE
ncbi:hypothetical protein [Amycolatopsis sp. NPDC004378]